MSGVNALISGQAGVAVLLEAEPRRGPTESAPPINSTSAPVEPKLLYAISNYAPSEKVPCATWADVRGLFAGADDVTELRDVTHEKAVELLNLAWKQDRALQLTLALLDANLKQETRLRAARSVEKLIAEDTPLETESDVPLDIESLAAKGMKITRIYPLKAGIVERFVANRLFSIPMPKEGADLQGAIELTIQGDGTTYLAILLRALSDMQQGIKDTRIAWDKLPLSLFDTLPGNHEEPLTLENAARCEKEKARLERILISIGLFCELAQIDDRTRMERFESRRHDSDLSRQRPSRYAELAAAHNIPYSVLIEWADGIGGFSAYRSFEMTIAQALISETKKLTFKGNSAPGAPKLTELPKSLGELRQLQELNLYGNHLTDVPDWFDRFTELRDLTLWNNRLTALPNVIGKLGKLERLDLDGNRLTELPGEMGALTQLRALYLSNNLLTDLPAPLGQLKHLKTLNLPDNPLNPELAAAAAEGFDAVMAHLRAKVNRASDATRP